MSCTSRYDKNATYTQIAPTIFEDRGLEWVDLPENRVYGILKERTQLTPLMFLDC
jgi:hypothetical protein